MRTNKTKSIPPIYSEEEAHTSYTDCVLMPVLKLDFNGAIVSSNRPGIAFLGKLRSLSSGSSLSGILHDFPGILTPGCSTDISVSLNHFIYYFSVVAFEEDGYVGLYGYQIKRQTDAADFS